MSYVQSLLFAVAEAAASHPSSMCMVSRVRHHASIPSNLSHRSNWLTLTLFWTQLATPPVKDCHYGSNGCFSISVSLKLLPPWKMKMVFHTKPLCLTAGIDNNKWTIEAFTCWFCVTTEDIFVWWNPEYHPISVVVENFVSCTILLKGFCHAAYQCQYSYVCGNVFIPAMFGFRHFWFHAQSPNIHRASFLLCAERFSKSEYWGHCSTCIRYIKTCTHKCYHVRPVVSTCLSNSGTCLAVSGRPERQTLLRSEMSKFWVNRGKKTNLTLLKNMDHVFFTL